MQLYLLVIESTQYVPPNSVNGVHSCCANSRLGLTSWENAPNGKIVKTDVGVVKNYLTKNELAMPVKKDDVGQILIFNEQVDKFVMPKNEVAILLGNAQASLALRSPFAIFANETGRGHSVVRRPVRIV